SAVATASRSPNRWPPKPPDPDATNATPTSDTNAATQKPRPIRSRPMMLATIPMKIGVVPKQRHRRRRGLVDRVHEAELVAEDHRRGDADVAKVAAREPERPFAPPREEPEQDR